MTLAPSEAARSRTFCETGVAQRTAYAAVPLGESALGSVATPGAGGWIVRLARLTGCTLRIRREGESGFAGHWESHTTKPTTTHKSADAVNILSSFLGTASFFIYYIIP